MILIPLPQSLLRAHIFNLRELEFSGSIVHSYIDNNNRWNLYVLGDSHAQQFYPDFVKLEKKHSINIIDKTGSACMLAEGMTYINPRGRIMRNCEYAYANYIKHFQRSDSSRTLIFMGARYMAYLSSTMIANGQRPVDGLLMDNNTYIRNIGNELQKAYLKKLEGTVKKLYARKIPIIFLAPYPELHSSTVECIYKPHALSCGVDKKINKKRIKFFMKGIKKISKLYPNFHIFSPFRILCPSKVCHNIVNGYALYRDTDHLTSYAVLKLYPSLEKLVLKLISQKKNIFSRKGNG
jgi:hypothetical protein